MPGKIIHIPESGIFCLKNPKSWALKYRIQLKEFGIPQTIKFEIQVQLTRNPGIPQDSETGIHSLDLFVHVAMLHETIHYFMVLIILAYACSSDYFRQVFSLLS